MMRALALLACCGLFGAGAAPVDPAAVRDALQKIAEEKAATYNCSVSIAFKSKDAVASAAAGIVDFSTGRKATVDDSYAFGSGT